MSLTQTRSQLIRTVKLVPAPSRLQLLLNNLVPLGIGILLTAGVGWYWHSQRGNVQPAAVPVPTIPVPTINEPVIDEAGAPLGVNDLSYPSPVDNQQQVADPAHDPMPTVPVPEQYVQEGKFDPTTVPYSPVFGDTPPPAARPPRMSSYQEALARYEANRQRLAEQNEAAEWALKQELLEDVHLAQTRANRHAASTRGY